VLIVEKKGKREEKQEAEVAPISFEQGPRV
jgi:hypothetical protein